MCKVFIHLGSQARIAIYLEENIKGSNVIMNPGAESFTILLQKGPNDPWGFRLQGGADFSTALSIQSVSISCI